MFMLLYKIKSSSSLGVWSSLIVLPSVVSLACFIVQKKL